MAYTPHTHPPVHTHVLSPYMAWGPDSRGNEERTETQTRESWDPVVCALDGEAAAPWKPGVLLCGVGLEGRVIAYS